MDSAGGGVGLVYLAAMQSQFQEQLNLSQALSRRLDLMINQVRPSRYDLLLMAKLKVDKAYQHLFLPSVAGTSVGPQYRHKTTHDGRNAGPQPLPT